MDFRDAVEEVKRIEKDAEEKKPYSGAVTLPLSIDFSPEEFSEKAYSDLLNDYERMRKIAKVSGLSYKEVVAPTYRKGSAARTFQPAPQIMAPPISAGMPERELAAPMPGATPAGKPAKRQFSFSIPGFGRKQPEQAAPSAPQAQPGRGEGQTSDAKMRAISHLEAEMKAARGKRAEPEEEKEGLGFEFEAPGETEEKPEQEEPSGKHALEFEGKGKKKEEKETREQPAAAEFETESAQAQGESQRSRLRGTVEQAPAAGMIKWGKPEKKEMREYPSAQEGAGTEIGFEFENGSKAEEKEEGERGERKGREKESGQREEAGPGSSAALESEIAKLKESGRSRPGIEKSRDDILGQFTPQREESGAEQEPPPAGTEGKEEPEEAREEKAKEPGFSEAAKEALGEVRPESSIPYLVDHQPVSLAVPPLLAVAPERAAEERYIDIESKVPHELDKSDAAGIKKRMIELTKELFREKGTIQKQKLKEEITRLRDMLSRKSEMPARRTVSYATSLLNAMEVDQRMEISMAKESISRQYQEQLSRVASLYSQSMKAAKSAKAREDVYATFEADLQALQSQVESLVEKYQAFFLREHALELQKLLDASSSKGDKYVGQKAGERLKEIEFTYHSEFLSLEDAVRKEISGAARSREHEAFGEKTGRAGADMEKLLAIANMGEDELLKYVHAHHTSKYADFEAGKITKLELVAEARSLMAKEAGLKKEIINKYFGGI